MDTLSSNANSCDSVQDILSYNANGCAQNIAAKNESVTLAEHVTHCRRDDIINVLIEYVTSLSLEHRIFSSSLICEAIRGLLSDS